MRAWICCHCGAVHDRDVNAARNILALGHERLAEESSSELRSDLVGEDVISLESQNGRATRYPNGDPSTSAINANPLCGAQWQAHIPLCRHITLAGIQANQSAAMLLDDSVAEMTH